LIDAVPLIVPDVVRQHAEEVVTAFVTRCAAVSSGHFDLPALGRLDERIAANLDGLAVAGGESWQFCEALVDAVPGGAAFAIASRAIQDREYARLDLLLERSAAADEIRRGVHAAIAWVSPTLLKGLVAGWLKSPDGVRRLAGVAACRMHGVDPGLTDMALLHDSDQAVRAAAYRTAGEIGLAGLTSLTSPDANENDVECQVWRAWSAVVLGNRSHSLGILKRAALGPAHRRGAFVLYLQAASAEQSHELLKDLSSDPLQLRWLINGSGIAGDPAYVPWLINHMRDDQTARLAGESFSLITGTDLSALQLDRPQPEDFESGPNDDPDDPNVDMDPDDGLPWPDVEKIEKWWAANAARFQKGTRYFIGAPVTRGHCIHVLKNGYQRQRILAAHYLCLLEPGTPLFNTSAPAWRQQRLLARM
jgi:uncharacterized protein (TIGR02270 family)